jgi:hypothetical protein
MFEDWSTDVDQVADDSESAGSVNRTWPALPSERHRQVLDLLYANSRIDAAGRRVTWWPQEKLAAKLGITSRHLRRILADLREPGLDPRHPRGQPPGLRLALVKVEPTTYRDQASGRHRLGGNVYVLLEPRQQDMAGGAVSAGGVNRTQDPMSCLNKGENHKPVREDGSLGVLDVGRQQPLQRLDYDPTRGEVLSALEAGLGPVEVLGEWRNDQPPGQPTYTTARGHPLELTGSLADFRRGVDQLDRNTCMDTGCTPGHPCRRHTRRNRVRGR